MIKNKTGLYVYFVIMLIGALSGASGALNEKLELSFAATSTLLAALTIRWFRQDALLRGYAGIFDRGMFIMMGGHVLLPLYLLWTRRFKGILLLLLALLAFVVPLILAVVLLKLGLGVFR